MNSMTTRLWPWLGPHLTTKQSVMYFNHVNPNPNPNPVAVARSSYDDNAICYVLLDKFWFCG